MSCHDLLFWSLLPACPGLSICCHNMKGCRSLLALVPPSPLTLIPGLQTCASALAAAAWRHAGICLHWVRRGLSHPAPCCADTVLSVSRHGMEPGPDGRSATATWALVQAAGRHAAPGGILSSEAAREVAPETLQVNWPAYMSSVPGMSMLPDLGTCPLANRNSCAVRSKAPASCWWQVRCTPIQGEWYNMEVQCLPAF